MPLPTPVGVVERLLPLYETHMRLHISHTTQYEYQPEVEQAWHVACLRPRSTPVQTTGLHTFTVLPVPHGQSEQWDSFGNVQLYFSIHSAHPSLVVKAMSNVMTSQPQPLSTSLASLQWEPVREFFRYRAGAPFDGAMEFRFASPCIQPHAAFADYAWPSFGVGRPLADAAVHLMQRIHRDFTYLPASTSVNTSPLEALKAKTGVCQDFAHVLVACLRAQGLCARYVSGYLLTEPPPGQARLIGADASHAWASVYLPPAHDVASGQASSNGVWLDLDPTNDRSGVHSPGEDYVTLAWGRDFSDVSPLRGVLHGGSEHEPKVAVTVMPMTMDPHADPRSDPNIDSHGHLGSELGFDSNFDSRLDSLPNDAPISISAYHRVHPMPDQPRGHAATR